MTWLPRGEDGILVNLGGIISRGGQSIANPISKVNVFDIKSSTWFTQTAVAGENEVPEDRSFFSAVTPTPNENQTHWEIVFYGGVNSTGGTIDDIWALSLPNMLP